jgi:hypothetical protein
LMFVVIEPQCLKWVWPREMGVVSPIFGALTHFRTPLHLSWVRACNTKSGTNLRRGKDCIQNSLWNIRNYGRFISTGWPELYYPCSDYYKEPEIRRDALTAARHQSTVSIFATEL